MTETITIDGKEYRRITPSKGLDITGDILIFQEIPQEPKEDDFCLSDNLMKADNKENDNGFYWEKDVKEFIRRLKDEVIGYSPIRDGWVLKTIDKLAGDELAKKLRGEGE